MEVNLLAVLVSAVAAMVLGALWFSPVLFANAWMNGAGLNSAKIKATKGAGMATAYIVNFIASLVTAYVLANFLIFVDAKNTMEAIETAFWLWLGFVAAIALGSVLWEGKSFQYYLINVVFHLISFSIMGAILINWPA